MPINKGPTEAEAIRQRVVRAVRQVLRVPDLHVYVKYAFIESNTIRIHVTTPVFECALTAPAFGDYEDMVVRVQQAFEMAKVGHDRRRAERVVRGRS